MLHSHTRLWIHIVWVTKRRKRLFFKETGQKLFRFLLNKSKELNVNIEQLNIQPEHIHLLIDLPSNMCLCDYVRNMKGSSSHWINKNNIIEPKFSWQRGYGGYSVSGLQLKIVKNYIKNQTEHHHQKAFAKEYDKWRIEYGLFDD